ncbi:Predicted RNA-binding protein containing a PIN domain [Micromonospora phaseoli]|uniref:Predicted RNA-binding protein containing a PIN domain n=1 Tax=Micromonospora phaseoli TaxID=1144548 RepID=A0A1H7D5F2_9ACTN|nr:NYN domain-containing protein [Micromonospora phaseoli]PZV98038.1 putative RNA-binding protein with PIN domain [Micromonospora phaseoli]GIJ77853.1 RNA-binding protein [Micromonospora phaseoli]SEJ94782.1 Predicted RNA-binding protein containing a PIN domain [Micromonospora phaseoli]
MPLAEPHDDNLPQEERVVGAPAAGEAVHPDAAEAAADREAATEPEPSLPEAVRQRIVSLTAAVLPGLPADEVPVPLRRVAKFAPNRRARLGAPVIAAQLAADPLFRQRVTARVLVDAGDLGAAVIEGTAPAAADPVEVAALAYLARPSGWRGLIEASGAAVRAEADTAVVAELVRQAEQRATRADHDRAVARVEADKLRDELARVREELGQLREEARQLTRTLRESQARERRASELLATERGRATRAAADADAELRRARARLAEAEAAAGVARTSAKEARSVDNARLWLLLETIGQAALGLRRELALDPVDKLPADFVADAFTDSSAATATAAGAAARAQDTDDPARLDQLLALPRAHLVVDGYNVTKRGFGEMSLEQQRKRLITGLGGLAAQTGDEVTVVFDGAERMHGLPPTPRGVRVLFSRKGETADELIRRLVRAEPPGRPVVVISSDREVADGVRRHGAYPLGADSLLRRLARS